MPDNARSITSTGSTTLSTGSGRSPAAVREPRRSPLRSRSPLWRASARCSFSLLSSVPRLLLRATTSVIGGTRSGRGHRAPVGSGVVPGVRGGVERCSHRHRLLCQPGEVRLRHVRRAQPGRSRSASSRHSTTSVAHHGACRSLNVKCSRASSSSMVRHRSSAISANHRSGRPGAGDSAPRPSGGDPSPHVRRHTRCLRRP